MSSARSQRRPSGPSSAVKDKPKPDEYRMKTSEFDAIMRRALGTPPLPERKPKAAKKTVGKAASKK